MVDAMASGGRGEKKEEEGEEKEARKKGFFWGGEGKGNCSLTPFSFLPFLSLSPPPRRRHREKDGTREGEGTREIRKGRMSPRS